MTTLFHITSLSIFLMFCALSKNLINVYVIVRLSGSIPTRVWRIYQREFIAFVALSVTCAVLVVVTLVTDMIAA